MAWMLDSKINWLLGLLLIVSALSVEWLSTYFMIVLSRFYQAIVADDHELFFSQLKFACAISLSTAVLKSVKNYCAQRGSLQWRSESVKEVQKYYFGPYGNAMKETMRSLDNVDQRITQDIENLSLLYAKLAESVIVVPFVVVYYSYYLLSLLGIWAIAIAFFYFIIGAMVGSILMNRLVAVVYYQEVLEGDFRFYHSCIRINHWIIVLLKGLLKEKSIASSLLDKVVMNRMKMINISFVVDAFSFWFDYTGSIVNYAIVGYILFYLQAGSHLSSEQRLTSFTTGSYALLYLINAFSTLIDTAKTVGEAKGLHRRLSELLTVLKAASSTPLCSRPTVGSSYVMLPTIDDGYSGGTSRHSSTAFSVSGEGLSLVPLHHHHDNSVSRSSSSVLFSVRQLTLRSLDGERVLLRGLTLDLLRGMRLLISGPSGCGKSTLLNSLNLLLQKASDNIEETTGVDSGSCQFNIHSDEFAACSQSPYCFQGTLLDNITYPVTVHPQYRVPVSAVAEDVSSPSHHLLHPLESGGGSDEAEFLLAQREARELLTSVDLQAFIPEIGRGSERNWSSTTSEGERQRLCVARMLYHRPKMCFLDEATSAVDEETEGKLYELISSKCDTFVSIGHRSTLRKYHTHELKISPLSQNCTLEAVF